MCVCTCKPGYDTSLTDGEWAVIEPLLPVRDPRHGGRPLKYDRRLILDTILYVLRTGCAWRHVPHDLAPWDAAYRWFAAWSADGTWQRVHAALRDQVRDRDGRDRQPSAAVLDAQSARSAEGVRRTAMTPESGCAAASAICWSTPAGCCCTGWCTRPACKTAPAPD